MQRGVVLVFLMVKLAIPTLAQQAEVGNWLMYFSQARISNKVSIHSEIQYRNHTLLPTNIEQMLLRAGANYHVSPSVFVSAGYGYVATHEYETEQVSPETEEHRIWQQLIMTNAIGRVTFEHRYRIEQRWIGGDYKNRLRYRVMLFVPLNKSIIEKGTFFLGFYDEVFINTRETFFDRNRLYGALGYQLNPATGIQIGMLHQQLNESNKWYLQLALVFNPDLTKNNN